MRDGVGLDAWWEVILAKLSAHDAATLIEVIPAAWIGPMPSAFSAR